ncbi:hypothetical protein CDL12_15105 [Handroanthus impetiginosus]|uniref:F-box domain-containing protein n=1 Tax=Handroanthus impetiginosus TaxID=429701 RepID=A0A2G9H439_9LAMI|nr:hypothetical protein CDL12_15105 [Handroanthus impetiginosus]
MDGGTGIGVSWSDLPKELLEMIAKCLDTETDVRRFRAVCSSWRSSTTPFKKFPFTPLKLPFPFAAGGTSHPKHQGAYFNLTERTVYRVQLPESKEPSFWLVKIESSKDGKFRILNPVSDHQIKILPETHVPEVLNTLDFRVSEVCKAYTLQYVNPSKHKQNDEYKYAKKVTVSTVKNDEYVVMAIDYSNKLWYIKSGDKKWTMVRVEYNNFLDVVNYKGRFYGIDLWGGTWVFDSMFEATKFPYNACHKASKRHLVESYDRELLLVELVTDKDKTVCTCYDLDNGCHCKYQYCRARLKNTAVQILISRMDELVSQWVEMKTVKDQGDDCSLVEMKTVNDQIIFAGDDCSFSVSAKEFEGCKGTRVFYADRYILFRTEEVKKPHYLDNYYYDYGYNYLELDCGYSSSDDDGNTQRVDTFVSSDDINLKF